MQVLAQMQAGAGIAHEFRQLLGGRRRALYLVDEGAHFLVLERAWKRGRRKAYGNKGILILIDLDNQGGEGVSDTALKSRTRRTAKRVDLVATKSRRLKNTNDNLGGFQLVDPHRKAVVSGSRYDLSAQDVIDFCTKHVGND